MVNILCLFVLAFLSSTQAASRYVPTPHGYMRSDCIHSVPSGSILSRHPETNVLQVLDGTRTHLRDLPRCDVSIEPMFLHNKKEAVNEKSAKWELPPGYDGWTAYTAFKVPTSFDAYLGNFSVPDAPQNTPEMFFLFTGLQNEDWIPKVDPEPETGFDIIQPVLQFPADAGNYFSVKSWYVTTDIGTVYSDEIVVDSGDNIFGNMTRTGDTSWFIGSTVVSTGQTTSITVDHTRLLNQPWAYNTLEMYGAEDCSTYPTEPVLFSSLDLVYKGQSIPAEKVKWQINPKNQPVKFCNEKPVLNTNGTVVIQFV